MDDKLAEERLESTFEVQRHEGDHPQAVDLLKDLSSAMSVAEYYKKELEKRHERFDKEKYWPYMSQEEQKLIEHYQHYMEKVKVHQDKIMRTVSLMPPPATNDSPPESPDQSMDTALSSVMSTELGALTNNASISSGCGLSGQLQSQVTTGSFSGMNSQGANPIGMPLPTAISALYTSVHVVPQVVSYKEMCTTGTLEDNLSLERMRKFVFEVKKSPKNGAEIMRGFERRNNGVSRNQLLKTDDARCLINLSSLFYDNLYKEEIKGHSMKHAYFVLAFQNYVNLLSFRKDQANNVIVSNAGALKVIKTLFEGHTRKIGANNFLRHIYTSKFSKIRIPEYQEKIIREILKTIKPPSRTDGISPNNPNDQRGQINRGLNPSAPNALSASHHDRTTSPLQQPMGGSTNSSTHSDKQPEEKKKRNGLKRFSDSIVGIFKSKDKDKDGKLKNASSSDYSAPEEETKQRIGSVPISNIANQAARHDDAGEVGMEFEGARRGNHLSQTQRIAAGGQMGGQMGGPRAETEVNNDEYERIRILLGAGAHGDHSRLSDIFLKEKRKTAMADQTNKDPYNAMRFLNQEIDEEILNKNCMLKDLMVDQHHDSAQAIHQVPFNEREFFMNHRAILQGGHAPDSAPFDCAGKDLTDLCKHIVHQVLKSLVISTDAMPYTLRAMMKILVIKSESVAHPSGPEDQRQPAGAQDQPRGKTKLGRNQIYMLADLMIGCWLNTGFRNPSCYGVQQPTDREKGFSHNLFQSCRVIFEHLFSFQTLPENKKHQNFDVERINKYIMQFRDFIYIFYTRIIDVELPPELTRIAHQEKPQVSNVSRQASGTSQQVLKYSVNSSLMRMQDLQLIAEILKEQKAFIQVKSVGEIAKKIDWERFRNQDTTYFLFTKMKRDRVVKVPKAEDNEAAALKLVLGLTQHFSLENSDLGAANRNIDRGSEVVVTNGILNPHFNHAIKPDKKGKNPASMLLKVLYKQLVYLMSQNTVLINDSMVGDDLSFDKVLDLVRKRAQSNEDGSGIVIACQLMKKALKGLRLVTRSTMIPAEKQKVLLIQNRLLERFSIAFNDKCKQAYYTALVTQDLKLQSFENDVERFVSRSHGLQESIEKVIAQWHIAKISACEVSLCVYQNTKDEFPCFQGIYLTRNCPIDQEWMALAKLIQFDIFDTPRLPSNINSTREQLVPRQNQLVPARQENQRIIYSEYRSYTDFTWVSILRPLRDPDEKKQASGHREITYLESLLLYLTTECKQIFQNLIRCDYLLESYQVKQVRQQIKAMLSNYKLQGMVNHNMTQQNNPATNVQRSTVPLPDLSNLHNYSIISADWAKNWLQETQAQWDLWNSLYCEHKTKHQKDITGCARDIDDYIKYIEIDEKFSRMQFIQKSLRVVQQNRNDTPLFLLEIDQLMQDRDGRAIKLRMTKRDVKQDIQDHGNFLQTFNFFLDNLLCDLTQNGSDAGMSYDQLVKQDAQTEKIRQSCQEFILRRIHNGLFDKIAMSDWDKNMLKVIYDRKKKMEFGRNSENSSKPLYKENEKDLNLYKVSIDMLKQLPREETPRTKRQLLNDALKLARHALEVLKQVTQDDDDYLFAYMMHYACTKDGKRRTDFRIFQQLVFMSEFGKGAGSQASRSSDEDPIDVQFKGLKNKIIDESNEQAVKALTRSSFLIF